MQRVILDTNIFVAAGFKRRSASARLVEAAAAGRIELVWDEQTRGEIERVVHKIPLLDDAILEGLFREEHHCQGETHPDHYTQVEDPTDRRFAALAAAADAVLVSQDDHLLGERESLDVEILRPVAAAERLLG